MHTAGLTALSLLLVSSHPAGLAQVARFRRDISAQAEFSSVPKEYDR